MGACAGSEDVAERELEADLEAELSDEAEVELDSDARSVHIERGDIEISTGEDLDRPDWLDDSIPTPEDMAITSILVYPDIRSVRGSTPTGGDELRSLYEAAFDEARYEIEQPWRADAPITMKVRDRDGEPVSIQFDDDEDDLFIVVGRE